MPPYSFHYSGSLFDLVLPKHVLEVTANIPTGETAKFLFVDSLKQIQTDPKQGGKPYHLTITRLEDGSINITNKLTPHDTTRKVHPYVSIMTAKDSLTTSKDPLSTSKDPLSTSKDPPYTSKDPLSTSTDLMTTSKDSLTASSEPSVEDSASPTISVAVSSDVKREGDESASRPACQSEAEPCDESDTEVVEILDHDHAYTVTVEGGDSRSPEPTTSDCTVIMQGEDGKVICPLCEKAFRDTFYLHKHIGRSHRTHQSYQKTVDDILPLLQVECSECHKTFKNCKILKEHKEKVHPEQTGVACPHCGKEFRTKHHMKFHLKYVHLRTPDTVSCQLCPAKFNSKAVLRQHVMYTHTTHDKTQKCAHCSFTYSFHKQYYEHLSRVHGPKKHTCGACGYRCATKWYMQKHEKNCSKNNHIYSFRVPSPTDSNFMTPEATKVITIMQTPVGPTVEDTEPIESLSLPVSAIQAVMIADTGDDISENTTADAVEHYEMTTEIMEAQEQIVEEVSEIVIKPELEEFEETEIYVTGSDGQQHLIKLAYAIQQ